MPAETFTVFRTRMGAPTGWSADDFLSDPGEALLMEGGVQKHEWTAASPTTIQKSWLRGKLNDLKTFDFSAYPTGGTGEYAVDTWWDDHGRTLVKELTKSLRSAGEAPDSLVASKYSAEMATGQILTGQEVDTLLAGSDTL